MFDNDHSVSHPFLKPHRHVLPKVKIHALPACDKLNMKMIFGFACLFLTSTGLYAFQTTMQEDFVSMSWIIGGMAMGIVGMAGFIVKLVLANSALHQGYNKQMQDMMNQNALKNEMFIRETTQAMQNQATTSAGLAKVINAMLNTKE